MANIRDVAKHAGVGIATVSRYINNDGYVSEGVAQKIQLAIDELNYKPNALARALFTKSSMMIGLIIPNIVNPFYPELAVSIETRAKEKGYSIVLSNTEYSEENERTIFEMLQQHRVDGIIVANASLSKEYSKTTLPIVSVEKEISESITYVAANNYNVGKLVAEYIQERKLSKILHIKGPDNVAIAYERYQGFKETLEHYNKSFDEVEGIYGEDIVDIGSIASKYDIVFVWNDDLAISFLSECYKAGLRVPDDLEVIGVDDIYYSTKTSPPLTTVKLPIAEMGEKAVDLLIEQIENKKSQVKAKVYDVELIHRDSTKKNN